MLRMMKETKLTEAADKILGGKKPYEGKKKMTPWWSDEVKEAVKFKMIKFRRWMKTRTPEDRAQYTIARNEAESEERCKGSLLEANRCESEEDFHGTKKFLYSLSNNYR